MEVTDWFIIMLRIGAAVHQLCGFESLREERNRLLQIKLWHCWVKGYTYILYASYHVLSDKNDLLHDIKCCEFIFLKNATHTEKTVYYTNCFTSLNVECVTVVVIECCKFCQVSTLCAQFYHSMFLSLKLLLHH